MNTISEKPPIPDSVTERPPVLGNSPATRRRKINRASPVPIRRNSSPPVRRSRTFDATSTRHPKDKEHNSRTMDTEKIQCKIQHNEKGKTVPDEEMCSCVRKRSVSNKEVSTTRTYHSGDAGIPIDVLKVRRQDYLNKRRSTFATIRRSDAMTQCQCRSHKGALKKCVCSDTRRQIVSPKISESELMEKETRLVVLEFLRALTPEQLSGRRQKSRESSVSSRKSAQEIIEEIQAISPSYANDYEIDETVFLSDVKRDSKRQRSSTQKFNTVTIGESEHRQLMEMLSNKNVNTTRLGRSRSDVSNDRYTATRAKIQKLQVPIKKWIEDNSTIPVLLKREIVNFEKSQLKNKMNSFCPETTEGEPEMKEKKKNLMERKNMEPLSLKIPSQTLPSSVPPDFDDIADLDIFTPETYAVNRLEAISIDIMRSFPDLLHDPISVLISVSEKNESVDYDLFSKIAKPVFNLAVPKFTNVWSRVALVLYMVRETVFEGNLNDRQLELLVEHSTKFFTENAKQSVEEEGGWESALGEQIFFASGVAFDECGYSSDENEIDKKCPQHGNHVTDERDSGATQNNSPATRENTRERSLSVSDTAKEWSTYGVVVVALALGIAYSCLKY